MKTLFLVTATLFWATTFLIAGGKKAPSSTVSFHLEGGAGDGPKMVFPQMVAGQNRHFRITPELTHNQVVAFSSFPSETGDYGLVLQLNKTGRQRLYSVSAANNGKWLIAQANGRVVDAVTIDQAVSDGYIVIWKGISGPEIKALELSIPRIGDDKKEWKKRVKEIKKELKRQAKQQ